jgi:hypothetical protein
MKGKNMKKKENKNKSKMPLGMKRALLLVLATLATQMGIQAKEILDKKNS